MAFILHIETTSDTCSVCVAADGEVAGLAESETPRSHASVISVLIERSLKAAGLGTRDLSAVAVSEGPGSYTGLRIGVSAAKGLCYGTGIPLIAVPTLQSMAASLAGQLGNRARPDVILVPMVDARRMEVYSAVLSGDLRFLRETKAEILDAQSFDEWKDTGKDIYFFGSGMEKFRALGHGFVESSFIPGFMPSSTGLVGLARERWEGKQFADTAYFEPFYLKDFVSGGKK